MSAAPIQFSDAAGYEAYMGPWSRLVGDEFLRWFAPTPGAAWLDVGCGTGAFSAVILERCAPRSVDGVDPAEEQLAFARTQPGLSSVTLRRGDAMALPYADGSFDVAVMPLVIFFVPDPLRGVREMARVVRPGGWVTAYGWDLTQGGFPYDVVQAELEGLGVPRRWPPSPEAGRIDRLREVWAAAGLADVETHEIRVLRVYRDIGELLAVTHKSPNLGPVMASLTAEKAAQLHARLEKRLATSDGAVTLHARANAVRGRVRPGDM